MDALNKKLSRLFPGSVFFDSDTLNKFSEDASIFRLRPSAVVAPKEAQDVKKLVRFVTRERSKNRKLSLTASAARTDMSGGPLSDSLIVDFLPHFNQVVSLKKTKSGGEAVLMPGVFYRDFEKMADRLGLVFPAYPASKDLCAFGGIVSNNSGGERTLMHGKTDRYVRHVKVVLSDGNEYEFKPLNYDGLVKKMSGRSFEASLYKKIFKIITNNEAAIKKAKPSVTKNSAGYALWDVWDGKIFDICKLVCGSQGTLGLITEIGVRLVRKKKHDRLIAIFINEMSYLPEIIRLVLKERPENFESYDDNTLRLAFRFLPDIIKVLKPKNTLKLLFQFLPELFMLLKHGKLPRLVLLVQFAGDSSKDVNARVIELSEKLKETGQEVRVTRSNEEEAKYWTIRRESFSLLRKHVSGRRTAPFIDDFVVSPQHITEFLPRLTEILSGYKLVYTIAGHVGDGNFHIIPLMDFRSSETPRIIKNLSKRVYSLVLEYNGSITGEHNDGLIRTPFLPQMYGANVIRIFEEVKKAFDPLNIFNPGKKVYGDFAWAMRHIKKE